METRKQNRLQGYDYSRMGYYFVTICTKERTEIFWEPYSTDTAPHPPSSDTPPGDPPTNTPSDDSPSVGAACGRPPLNAYGLCVQSEIDHLSHIYDKITVDKYVIMPNHIHLILCIDAPDGGRPQAAPTVGHIINQFKGAVSKKLGFPLWQKSFHDHIIRSEADYLRIWHYIDTNPAKWREDCYYKDGEAYMPKDDKTNVMRLLDQRGIPYTPHTYPHEEGVAVDGVTVARTLGLDPETVFKTLLSRGSSGAVRVFVLPVGDTLDLKKAARAAGEKSIEMVHVKEITALSGYVRGGCSPVGMKKLYPTVFHETAEIIDAITVSAGKIGYQVTLAPADLLALVEGTTADIVV